MMEKMIADIGRSGRVRCEPGWHLSEDWARRLTDHDLWIVWAGRGWMTLREGRGVDLRPGVLIWARPGGTYLARQDPADRLGVSYIHFTPSQDLAEVPEVHHVRDVTYVDAVMRRVIELMQAEQATLARRLLGVLVTDLREGHAIRGPGGGAGGTARHHEQVVHPAAALLRESPGEALDIARLARLAGYSPDHFTRVFRAVWGQTPQAYAIDQRINRARLLLDETGLTVSGVAHALGYQSVPLFCRQFKARVGRSPGAYRRRAEADAPG